MRNYTAVLEGRAEERSSRVCRRSERRHVCTRTSRWKVFARRRENIDPADKTAGNGALSQHAHQNIPAVVVFSLQTLPVTRKRVLAFNRDTRSVSRRRVCTAMKSVVGSKNCLERCIASVRRSWINIASREFRAVRMAKSSKVVATRFGDSDFRESEQSL